MKQVFVPHCGVALCAQSPAVLWGSSPVVASLADTKRNPAFLLSIAPSQCCCQRVEMIAITHKCLCCKDRSCSTSQFLIFVHVSAKSGIMSVSSALQCTPPCALTPERGQCLALPKLATCLQGQPEYLGAGQLAERRSQGRPRSDLTGSGTRSAGRARGRGGATALVSCRLEQSGACRHRMDFSLCLATLAMTARTGEVGVSP